MTRFLRVLLALAVISGAPGLVIAQDSNSGEKEVSKSAEPKDLYTVATLATFAGASGAVLIFYNTFRRLSGRESLWAAFIISIVVSFVVAVITNALTGVIGYFMAALNGCLLFSSAAGAQEVIASGAGDPTSRGFTPTGASAERPPSQRGFWSSWFA